MKGLKQFWKTYGNPVIDVGIMIVIVVCTAGALYYKNGGVW